MPSKTLRRISCPSCHGSSVCGPDALLALLRQVGMLRRQKEPSEDLILQLIETALPDLICDECGHQGLVAEPYSDEYNDEDWGIARTCESCGATMDAERVELFPNATLCARCQQKIENGDAEGDEPPDYCPRCGCVMKLKRAGGAGISRFQMRCDGCGYS